MKNVIRFKWFILEFVIVCTVLVFSGCCTSESNATVYFSEIDEVVTLSSEDTSALRGLLHRKNWEEFCCCEYVQNYTLAIDNVEYFFETLNYDPIYGECITYRPKGGGLSGIIPREGAENYKRILEILRKYAPESCDLGSA